MLPDSTNERLTQDRQPTYNVTLSRFRQLLLPWKSNKYFLLVCVCVCVRAACVCVRVSACGYPGLWACACAYVHVALLIQHATQMRHIVTSFVAPQSPPYVSTLSNKRCDFLKNVIEHKMCVLIFSTFVLTTSHSKKNLARYRKNVETSSCRIPVNFVGL
jgi:hypothetical protein